jgi:nucleotide-binding universal stress UspA family protein
MSVVAMLEGSETADRATTQTAIGIAKRLNVPVQGICALPDPMATLIVMSTPEATGLAASATQDISALQEKVIARSKATFEAASAGDHGLTCTFAHVVDVAERAGANAATLADAVVFPHSVQKAIDPLSLSFEYVLMDARLPVVMAGSQPITDGPVIVAWDGSNGAARAVRFHLPIIKAFGEVIIAQNTKDLGKDEQRDAASPAALEAWLGAHNVKHKRMPIEGEVAGALLALAKGSNASIIVAGAYGHSRIGERLFGGTTQRLLDAAEAPALALAR